MSFAIYYIMIGVAWIALLFFPRFTKVQLLKTFIAGCCSFCPLLMIGMEMGFWGSWGCLDVLVVAFFLFTPLFCLIALIWNIVDIVKYARKKVELMEYYRAWGQMVIWVVFVVYLLFVCGPMIIGIGC